MSHQDGTTFGCKHLPVGSSAALAFRRQIPPEIHLLAHGVCRGAGELFSYDTLSNSSKLFSSDQNQ